MLLFDLFSVMGFFFADLTTFVFFNHLNQSLDSLSVTLRFLRQLVVLAVTCHVLAYWTALCWTSMG